MQYQRLLTGWQYTVGRKHALLDQATAQKSSQAEAVQYLMCISSYRLPLLRVVCYTLCLIDGFITAAYINVAVVVRVISDEQLVVLQLQLF